MNIRHVTQKLKKLSKRFWPLTPWTVFFAALALIVCAEASALVIHHSHLTASKPPATTTSLTTHQVSTTQLTTASPTPAQNTSTSSAASSTKSSTSTKPATTATPTTSVPTVTMCDYDNYNKSALQHEYQITGSFLTSAISSTANQSIKGNITYNQAIDQLNQAITSANSGYASSYTGYVSERQQYGCAITATAPATVQSCTYTGYDEVANCIASIPVYPTVPLTPVP
jgi:hypothetical protein